MKTNLEKVFAITGYHGLFIYVSQSRNGIIVESLLNKKRMNAGPSMRVTTLSDVAMYTDKEEVPLQEVLEKVKNVYNGEKSIDPKSDTATLVRFIESVMPDYDRERVYPSHIKKLAEWYNSLQENDMLDFEKEEKEQEEDNKEKEEK
ncbi:MAG: DUF5606 domain-containing protein [Prevotellaceae bacterium]|jgi:hypothetical protein|nr:DUF5606 domain-containing protein [Prevotellaceae bacterium]